MLKVLEEYFPQSDIREVVVVSDSYCFSLTLLGQPAVSGQPGDSNRPRYGRLAALVEEILKKALTVR